MTCSPEATTASYPRASWIADGRSTILLRCLKPQASSTGHELVGPPGHRRDHDRDDVARRPPRVSHRPRRCGCAPRRDRRPAEIQHQPGHATSKDAPPALLGRAVPRKKLAGEAGPAESGYRY